MASLVIGLLLVGLLGCGNQTEAQQLADAGTKGANSLAAYYDSLAQDVLDNWEMEAAFRALLGVKFERESQKTLSAQAEALKRRAQMVRNLANTYAAFKELASYNASGKVKDAATELSQGLLKLPEMPKATGVDPSKIVGPVAGEIASWKQSRDIRRGNKLLLQALEKVTELFEKETEAYRSIGEERGEQVANLIKELIARKMVVAWPLLEKVPASLGLALVGGEQLKESPETANALAAIARVRAERLGLLSAEASNGIREALLTLAAAHRELAAHRGINLDSALSELQKANGLLDGIAQERSKMNK